MTKVYSNKWSSKMHEEKKINEFLSKYDDEVFINATHLREVLFENLPDIVEQLDTSAKLIAYCYGQKYIELICVLIPSKKGLKLGFNRGVDLPDPDNLLEGTGKISRFVKIKSAEQINSLSLKRLLKTALSAYRQRIATAKK
jgi:hypothetical protein